MIVVVIGIVYGNDCIIGSVEFCYYVFIDSIGYSKDIIFELIFGKVIVGIFFGIFICNFVG